MFERGPIVDISDAQWPKIKQCEDLALISERMAKRYLKK
jgi:hypothetical protein